MLDLPRLPVEFRILVLDSIDNDTTGSVAEKQKLPHRWSSEQTTFAKSVNFLRH